MFANRTNTTFNRRILFGLGAGVAGLAALSSCSTTDKSSSKTEELTFWNMPWGTNTFASMDENITSDYSPEDGLPGATYQSIQWPNFIQTFTSAVASGTGPAVSSGGSTLYLQFESQGALAYADDLVESWRSNGLYDDILPGLLDTLKVDGKQAALPYNLDMRVIWYNEELLEKAGTTPPTDWQGYMDACAALKKIDVYGYGTGAGSGSLTGTHALLCWMLNNGGGIFDAEQQPNCVTPENIEAMEFVIEMVKKGYVDPRSVSYTSDNVQSQWRDLRFGMGYDTSGLADNVSGDVASKLKVASPLTSPSGEQGALFFPNNIMMYNDTPSQEGSEAFLTYYYQNMAPLWTEHTGIGLPPLRSIVETPEFQEDANKVKMIDEWQPISRTYGAPGSNEFFLNVATIDGTPEFVNFSHSILQGETTAEAALTKLQQDIEPNMA